MGRNATITLINNTEFDWTDLSTDVDHGKFNKEPLKSVPKGTQMTFEVGNHTGAKIVPKGSLTYTIQDSNKTKFVNTWNHPFSGATSTYTCYSEPGGVINSVMSPPNPTGHDQSITFNVKQTVLASS